MAWEQIHEASDKLVWEREDGYAQVVARETASSRWVISLDRLAQAPEGDTYVHETAPDRDAAIGIAEMWLNQYDTT